MTKKLCAYCGKHADAKTMTPLYEEGNDHILCYCETCVDEVKYNLVDLKHKHLYKWGRKGQA
jgi:hypothetical protein